jgi:hypothetical protein
MVIEAVDLAAPAVAAETESLKWRIIKEEHTAPIRGTQRSCSDCFFAFWLDFNRSFLRCSCAGWALVAVVLHR